MSTKLVNGELVTISDSNPMPIQNTIGSNALSSSLTRENVFFSHGVSVAASAGNLSKMQIWNPVSSGKLIVVYLTNMWHTSGTVTYKSSLTNTKMSNDLSTNPIQNTVSGSTNTSVAEIYTQNNDATSASIIMSQMAITSTTPNGSNVTNQMQAILKEGNGVTIEALTQNMAIFAYFLWVEIDLADLPNIS